MNQNVKFTNTQLSKMTILKSKLSNVIFHQKKLLPFIFGHDPLCSHVEHLRPRGNSLKSTFYYGIMIPCKFLNCKKYTKSTINYTQFCMFSSYPVEEKYNSATLSIGDPC